MRPGATESWGAVAFCGDPTKGRFVAFVLDAGRIVGGGTVNSGRETGKAVWDD